MNGMTTITPGARVTSSGREIGIIERLDATGTDNEATVYALRVYCADTARHYTIPTMLIESVQGEGAQAVVTLTGVEESEYYRDPEEVAALNDSLPGGATMWQAPIGDMTLTIPIAREKITVYKRPQSHGVVRVHQRVETHEERVTVPVLREEVEVDYLSPEEYDPTAPPEPNETIIPIMEEQLVVERQAVVVEYLRIHKERLQDNRTISMALRHEMLEMTEQRTASDLPESDE